MTPERMRVKLAEWAGWKRCVCGDSNCGAWFPPGSHDPELEPPDYCLDLNAVRKLERRLDDAQIEHYFNAMFAMPPESGCFADSYVMHASASGRCEALCRTLGLWEVE